MRPVPRFVAAGDLPVLPKGVPIGASACSCSALYPSGVIASTTTTEDGRFTLPNAPVGADVHLVVQIGDVEMERAKEELPEDEEEALHAWISRFP